MPDESGPKQPSEFQHHRPARRAKGMKLVRIWVADPAAPGFREEADRQAAILRGRPEQDEALDFIERSADFTDWNGQSR